jgi:hypothetical protein
VKLTLEQERAFDDWIHQKLEHPTCHLCQSSHWKIGELIAAGDHNPGEHSTGAMVQLICRGCGHVVLFDASQIKSLHAVDSASDIM